MSLVQLGFEYFPDPTIGRPVYNGSIYVGKPDTDPTLAVNQKSVTLRQENGVEVPVSQPIKTGAGGVPIYNGSPVQILVEGDYSLSVLNARGALVYYIASALATLNPGAFGEPVTEKQTLSAGQTEVTFFNDIGFAVFYIGGPDLDRGRLIEGTDYTRNLGTNTVILTDSYPEGSILTGAFNDIDSTPFTVLSNYVNNISELRTADTALNAIAYLKGYASPGDGGHDQFLWVNSDLSAEVAADILSEYYVAPSSDLTGASGAWVRQEERNTYTLSAGETAVDFGQVILSHMIFVTGPDVNSQLLIPNVDYTIVTSTSINLTQSYPADTVLVTVSN